MTHAWYVTAYLALQRHINLDAIAMTRVNNSFTRQELPHTQPSTDEPDTIPLIGNHAAAWANVGADVQPSQGAARARLGPCELVQ
jgi:hypothetical protein